MVAIIEESSDSIINELKNLEKDILKELHYRIFKITPIFDVELSTYCNIDCSMCPREEIKRRMGIMKPKIFKILYDWLPQNFNLMFCGMGEPLLNPNIGQYIKMLKLKNINISITTNGLLLTKEKISELTNSNLNMIQISINAFTKKKYNLVYSNGDFDLLMKNLDYLSEIKDKKLIVRLTVVVNKENRKNIDVIKNFAKQRDFPIFFRRQHSRGGFLYNPHEYNDFNGCGLFVRSNFITWDGNILSCAHDLKGNTKLGNIKDTSFFELRKIKNLFIQKYKWFSICNNCDDIFSRYILLNNPEIVNE